MKKYFDKFYIVGKGGYGKQLSIMLKESGIIKSSIFIDDKLKFNLKKFSQLKKKINFNIFVSKPKLREKIYTLIKKKNFIYSTLVLSNSNIYTNKIGRGSIIEHYVLLSSNVNLGIGCFIFTGSVIGHNSKIGNFCNIGTNVTISGNVKIDKKVSIGSQSFISNNLKICQNVVIAPGSVVLKDITKPGVYHGNTLIKYNEK